VPFLHPSPRRTPALHEALMWFAGARLAGSLLIEACNPNLTYLLKFSDSTFAPAYTFIFIL